MSVNPGDAVLVQFSTRQCPHCKAMEPLLAQIAQQGCQVQAIDVDQHPDIARQFKITGVPTFVAMTAGRETGRVVGATNLEGLMTLWKGPGAVSQEPATRRPEFQSTDFRAPEAAQPPSTSSGNPAAQAMAATVRLKVEDATGFGFGTGTIIDTHDNEALVITCGHLFRESQGKGKVSADFFASGSAQSSPAQLIAYDLDRDVALISVRMPLPLQPVAVAPPGHSVRPGDRAFTIGCDKGADPSVRQTHITAVNKYRGRPNYTAAGQPVDGRSGGGIFSADGMLIGICNAADPADDEGLYAGLASVHWQLDQIGQSDVYQRSARAALASTAPQRTVAPVAAQVPLNEVAAVPQVAPREPARLPGSDGVGPAAVADDDAEIVFIVRSKRNPQNRSEVFVVDQAPPDLISRITHAARTTGEQRAALAQRAAASVASRPGMPPVVRGQTAE
jgi:thiol-disulfide isomerase/thioredoxin